MARTLHIGSEGREMVGVGGVGAATPFVFDDGGRAAAGYKGFTGDCVVRAIAIATQLPYDQVYCDLRRMTKEGQKVKGSWLTRSRGVPVSVYSEYLTCLGWQRVATMGHRTGIQVHLRSDELPKGRLILRLSKHVVAVIDGVLHDTYDSARGGTRGVYNYWIKK